MWKNIFLESCILSALIFGGFYINATLLQDELYSEDKINTYRHISGLGIPADTDKHISGKKSDKQEPPHISGRLTRENTPK
ncbi:MAG: hypothetical protein F3741_05775 [Nitrospinae bacterium]|nr:hypothetical protein [Nitrospinota bacterium]MZH41773.1 hypothetical protein [Nitrospinota bacterium]MZH46938.1 hypothetical protein [Nitrospinota bacterium]